MKFGEELNEDYKYNTGIYGIRIDIWEEGKELKEIRKLQETETEMEGEEINAKNSEENIGLKEMEEEITKIRMGAVDRENGVEPGIIKLKRKESQNQKHENISGDLRKKKKFKENGKII